MSALVVYGVSIGLIHGKMIAILLRMCTVQRDTMRLDGARGQKHVWRPRVRT